MPTALIKKAKALIDAVSHDDNGSMIAGQWMGGHGGLLSRATIKCADDLRREIQQAEANAKQRIIE